VAAENPRTVVVVMAGSAVVMSEWEEEVGAILMLWYPGMEGGHALADILTGAASPSGRLPFVIPRDEAHLPSFDIDARRVAYDLWHGYRKLARDAREPAFPFGFGLGYTRFAYRDLTLAADVVAPDGELRLSFVVENVGERAADEVAQVYVCAETSRVERAPRELKGFERVSLEPGEMRTIEVALPATRLAYFDEERDDFVVEATRYRVMVGRNERDEALSATFAVSS
jgi:beta-glucosidase